MGRQKKRRGGGTSALARLKKEYETKPGFSGVQIATETDGEKMSAVLLDFVAPYKEQVETKEAFEKLLVVAIVAWNASLMEGAERQALIDGVRAEIVSEAGEESGRDFEQIVKQFMRRKARYFRDNQRWIVDYRVTDSRHEYRVAVISTLAKQA